MDSGSVKHCMMTRGTIGELIPSFRSQIDRHDEQMCDIRRFAPLGPTQREGGANGQNAISTDHCGRIEF